MLFMSAEIKTIRIDETPVVTIRELLDLVKQSRVYTVSPTENVHKMAQLWRDNKISALLVIGDEDHLMGIVTERDGAWKVLAEDRLPSSVKVGEIMTPIDKIVTASAEDDLLDLLDLFRENNFTFRHIPVVVDGDIYHGIVSERDIFHYFVDHIKATVRVKAD